MRALAGRPQTTAGIAAFVTEPGAAMTYLSDVQWGLSERAFLLVVRANGSVFWVCPGAARPAAVLLPSRDRLLTAARVAGSACAARRTSL